MVSGASLPGTINPDPMYPTDRRVSAPDRLWRRALTTPRVLLGGVVLVAIALLCLGTTPWTLSLAAESPLGFDYADARASNYPPFSTPQDDRSNLTTGYSLGAWLGKAISEPTRWLGAFGYDLQGRSVLGRCLLGGIVSLAVGIAAAAISVVLGCGVGLIAGYRGGKADAVLMRFVDVIYGLPYILLVIMFQVALRPPLEQLFNWLNLFTRSLSI